MDRVIDVDHHELAGQAGEGHQHPKGDTVRKEFKLVYIYVQGEKNIQLEKRKICASGYYKITWLSCQQGFALFS